MWIRSLSSWLYGIILGRRSHSGHTRAQAIDRERNLDPYCSEPALRHRTDNVELAPGEAKAIAKIMRRYGAGL